MSVIEAMARAAAVGSGWIHEYEWGGPDGIFDTEDWRDAIRAALAEARKHGWQLVPVEVNDQQRIAALNTGLPGIGDPPLYEKIYRSMLYAAPSVEDA